jgi:hypothetical protein
MVFGVTDYGAFVIAFTIFLLMAGCRGSGGNLDDLSRCF